MYSYYRNNNVKITHNTIVDAYYYGSYLYYYTGNCEFSNNIFYSTRTPLGYALYWSNPTSSTSVVFDGNDWYNTTGSLGTMYMGGGYTTFSSYQAAAYASYGKAKNDKNVSVPFVSNTDD